MSRWILTGLAVLLLMAFAACRNNSAGPRRTKIRIALAVPASLIHLPLILAKELNYFADEGVDVVFEDTSGGSRALESLMAGGAEVVSSLHDQVVQMSNSGRDLKSFVLMLRVPAVALVALPSGKNAIRSVHDLKGGTVAITAPGSPVHLYVNYLLVKNGLSSSDVGIIATPNTAARMAALEHGKDAAILGEPGLSVLAGRHPDMTVLADLTTSAGVMENFGSEVYPGTVLVSTGAWLRQNPGTARALAKAVQRSLKWLRDHNAREVAERMPPAFRLEDRAMYEQAIARLIPVLSTDGVMPRNAVEAEKRMLDLSSGDAENKNVDVTEPTPMSTSSSNKRAILATIAWFAATGCTHSGTNKSPEIPVRIALTNVPISYLPVILAEALGHYKEQGLSVTIDAFSSASKVMHALLAGSADIAAGPYEQVIQLAAEHQHVKAFVLMQRHSSRVLMVLPRRSRTIRRVQDLKGAVVGVPGVGSTNHLFLNYLLLRNGLTPEDVKVVAIGTFASAVAAMQHGDIDAAVLSGSEPAMVSRQLTGAWILVDPRGASGARLLYGVDVYPSTVLHSTQTWIRDHPDTGFRVAHSIQRTLRWIQQHSPEQVLAAIPERYRLSDREADLETLRLMIPSFSPDGVMPDYGAQAVRKAQAYSLESVRRATFNLSETYTNEFVAPMHKGDR